MIDFNHTTLRLGNTSDIQDPELLRAADIFKVKLATEDIPSFDLSRLKTGAQICAGDYRVDYIWDKMFPEGAIILFYAKGGSGKSTLASQAGDAISAGLPFMGLHTRKTPVVIIDYENPMGVLKNRIGVVNSESSVIYWTLADEPPQLDKPEWENLKSLVATLGNPLLIFDTLQSACSDLNINENADYSKVMKKLKQLRELGATIVLLHHTPKSDATKYVGASVIYNQVDHVIAQYPVKQAGTDKEAAEDDDTVHVYRFGSKDKTRYAHHKIFVTFDEAKKVFIESEGPDQSAVRILYNLITELAPVNQTTLLSQQTVISLIGKGSAKRILKTYSGVAWESNKGPNNADIFTPIFGYSVFRPYIGPENRKTEFDHCAIGEKPTNESTLQSGLNSEFDGLPKWAK